MGANEGFIEMVIRDVDVPSWLEAILKRAVGPIGKADPGHRAIVSLVESDVGAIEFMVEGDVGENTKLSMSESRRLLIREQEIRIMSGVARQRDHLVLGRRVDKSAEVKIVTEARLMEPWAGGVIEVAPMALHSPILSRGLRAPGGDQDAITLMLGHSRAPRLVRVEHTLVVRVKTTNGHPVRRSDAAHELQALRHLRLRSNLDEEVEARVQVDSAEGHLGPSEVARRASEPEVDAHDLTRLGALRKRAVRAHVMLFAC